MSVTVTHASTPAEAAFEAGKDLLVPTTKASILSALDRHERQIDIAAAHGVTQAYVSKVKAAAHELFDLCDRYHLHSPEELERGLGWEDYHRLLTLLELDRTVRARGYTSLDDEALAAQVAFDLRAAS